MEDEISPRKEEWCITKTKMALLAVLIFFLLIVVVVLAVLFGMAESSSHKDSKGVERTTVSAVTPTVHTTPGTEAWWNARLPTNIIPKHYNLFMNITVDLPEFDGHVGIDIEVKNTTDLIILHNNGLNISSVQVLAKTGREVLPIQNHFSFVPNEFQVVRMVTAIHPGLYLLKMAFKGLFGSENDGLYRQTFSRPNGQRVNFASTQFEANYARKAFPCFDEPALKATFNISIAHRSDYIALCNMPIYKTEITNGQTIDYYEKTVIMPTYLLAFVVGDFKYVETISKNNITMRYYSRPSFINKTQYALSIGGKIMTFFEDRLGIRYSLPKEDQVAVPKFGGAMENWGIILYEELSLLWDSSESTEEDKKMIAIFIAHELAHQWFGNIVTMKWWNDLWLNEGFAMYFEHIGMRIAEPAWNKEDDVIATIMKNSFLVDSELSSNPIKMKVEEPSDMMHTSSIIYYDKAGCIIRMMEDFLGNETFLEGLKIYLRRHAFANADSDDLWRAMAEASCARGQCVDVKQIMDPWILQMGYPVVTFKRINSTHYLVNQSRFLLNDNGNETNSTYKSPFRYSWVIPLTYVLHNKAGHHFVWMNMSSTIIAWDGSGWIKANTNYKGFYITNYEESNWAALAKHLNDNHTALSPSDRAGILMDAFLLSEANKLNYSTAIRMTEYMTKEMEYVPWKVLFEQANKLLTILPRTSKAYKYLMKYLAFLGKDQYKKLGIDDSGDTIDKFKRSDFLRVFCKAQVKSCIDNTTKRFQAWMENPDTNAIPPNLREVVFYYGVAHGGVEEWDFLYDQYNKTKDYANKRRILFGLSASREAWVIERYLSYALEPGRFEKDEMAYVFYCVSKYNPIGHQLAWNFVRMNWKTFVSRYDETQMLLYSKVAPEILAFFNTEYDLSEVRKFHQKIKPYIKGEDLHPERLEDEIKKRIQWLGINKKEIEKTLESKIKKYGIL